MHVSPILKDKLIVGSCPMTEGDIIQLKATGIGGVLSLQTDEDFVQREIDWPAMEDAYQRHGIEVRRFPIEDFSPRDVRQKLRPAIRLLTELIRTRRTVYLHCNAGINRSPTVAVAYLHLIEMWDLQAAQVHVMNCRPCDPYVEEVRLASQESG